MFLRKGEAVVERPLHELADEPTWAAGVLAGKRARRRSARARRGTRSMPRRSRSRRSARSRATSACACTRRRASPYLHPGVAGELVLDREVIGWFGEVHPDVRKRLGVDGAVFAFEVELDKLPLARARADAPIPRFPGSERDVSLLLAEDDPGGAHRRCDRGRRASRSSSRIRLLEDYRDAKLGAGMKSMLWSIAYRAPDRTLTDVEVDKAHEAIVGRLVENLPAQRR